MLEASEETCSIVTGVQLPGLTGQRVLIIGLVSDATPGGISFTLKSTDNINVPVTMKKPLTDAINGYVQVIGTPKGKALQGEEVCTFSNQNFDAKHYNSLCTILNRNPNLFISN